MSDPFWGLVTLPLLFNWNPTISVQLDTNQVVAVVEAEETVDARGFLLIPLRDGECEQNKDQIVSRLAEIWPVGGEVVCQVAEPYSYIQVQTEITLAPPSYEGLETPELVIEVEHTGGQALTFAHLTMRSSRSLAVLIEAMTEYASPLPLPNIDIMLENKGLQPVSLSPSAVFVQEAAQPAGKRIEVEAGSAAHFRLSDVDAQLPAQGQDHRFATISFLPPRD